MRELLQMTPSEFVAFLKKNHIHRFYFIFSARDKTVKASHAILQPIAQFLQNDRRDFAQHEGIFAQVTREYDILQGAFIHRTNRGQSQGGTRFWSYHTLEDYLRDGLRLSKGMTRKNALAGLWWGGGKGVIARDPDLDYRKPNFRAAIFRQFGELMTSLRGCYVTAEDVGCDTRDIAHIFTRTRFVTCIPVEAGGSGNPSIATAEGVVRGMEAALKFLKMGTLNGKKVVVQGLGHVGGPLVQFLFEKGVAEIIACDINPESVKQAKEQFQEKNFRARIVEPGDLTLLTEPCDILAPCATGALLNPQTIPQIQAKIVCGCANNQLEDTDRDDRLLFERGIIYVPDFLVNRMGIVNCANEQYGYVNHDPFIERHLDTEWEHSIYQTTLRVLDLARRTGEPPAFMAIRLADELSAQEHPIFGHRGQQIIDSLVANNWHEQG